MESPEREDLRDMLADIRRRLHALETADRLGSSSFREPGTIRYYDADGNVRLLFGTLVMPDGTELGLGLLVQRADGTDILQVWDGQASLHHADGTVGVAVADAGQVHLQGNDDVVGMIVQTGQRDIRFADDEDRLAVAVIGSQVQIHDWDGNVPFITRLGGAGLSRPKLQWFMAPIQLLSQMVAVTSATFQTTHVGYLRRASQTATAAFRIITAADTTADVQLVDVTNGVTLDSSSFPVGTNTYADLTGDQNGDIGTGLARMELQVRRTAGTGNAYVQMVGGWQD